MTNVTTLCDKCQLTAISTSSIMQLAKAKETVTAMREKMQEIRTAMDGTGKALHEAIKAFRAANPRLVKIPTPSGG